MWEENDCISADESPEEVPVGAIGRYTLRIRKWWCSYAVWWKMAGSSEVTGMKCMDWFSLGRLPRNWHRQQVMDYRARPFCEFPRRVRTLKTLPVSLALMLRTSLWCILPTRSLSLSLSLSPSLHIVVRIFPVYALRLDTHEYLYIWKFHYDIYRHGKIN